MLTRSAIERTRGVSRVRTGNPLPVKVLSCGEGRPRKLSFEIIRGPYQGNVFPDMPFKIPVLKFTLTCLDPQNFSEMTSFSISLLQILRQKAEILCKFPS